MSFDYNPQQQNNPEFDLQAESQIVNAFNEEKSKKPTVPLDDVALGVSYYYSAIKTVILMTLAGLGLIFVYAFFVGLTDNRTSFFQEDKYTALVGWFTLLIMAIVSPFWVKSTSCFCRTPSIINRSAKSTVIISWALWIIAFVMMILNGSNANNQESSFVNVIACIMYGVSWYLFMSFISSIGKFCLPKNKGCTAAIVLIMIYYVISVFSALNAGSNPENLNSTPLSEEANSASGLTSLGSLLCLIGGIMYLSYIEKLNRFFKTKVDINRLKNENSKKSTSSILIALVVFSVLGLIGYLGSAIPNMKSGLSNVKAQQTLGDYAKIEKTAMDDWNATFAQYSNQKMSDEQFDNWITNTHLPAWENALSVLDQAKEIDDNPAIGMLKTITQDRIAYCQGFHAALQQHSEELYLKAFQDFQRVDLKVTKLTYINKEVPKDVAQQVLLKSVVADDIQMAKWAISNGADVNKDINGVKPLQVAQEYKIQDMIDFLKENGATE